MLLNRILVRNLSKNIIYSFSQKKITEDYRKPIQQLRKQKQQHQPKIDVQKLIKPVQQFYANQMQKYSQNKNNKQKIFGSGNKQHIGQSNKDNKNKKDWKDKNKRDNQSNKDKYNKDAQNKKKQQNKFGVDNQNKEGQKNWLEHQLTLEDSKQYAQLFKQTLFQFQNKNLKQVKNLLNKSRQKFGIQGYQNLLITLFKSKSKFIRVYDSLKQLDIELKVQSTKILNFIMFQLAQNEQINNLQSFLIYLHNEKVLLDFRHQQFFDLLFSKQINLYTSQKLGQINAQSSQGQVKFLTGQNGIKFSLNNKILLQKLNISLKYLNILSQNSKKKKSLSKPLYIPNWFDNVSKIIINHKFAIKQFKNLVNQIFINNDYILPEWFYQSHDFSILLKLFYFGNQQDLELVLNVFQKNSKNVKFSTFYKNFTSQLMNFRIQNNQPAFQVDQVLINHYKKAFDIKNKYVAIFCATIASDAKYVDLSDHYLKYYMQGFPNQSLSSQQLKYVEQGILNNFFTLSGNQKNQRHQKIVIKISKGASSSLNKIKALIKLGQQTSAFKVFQEEIFKKVAIQRQRKNIQFVLHSRLGYKSGNYQNVKQLSEFIQTLNDQYLWSLYNKSQDLSVMLKNYLPQDKYSFWEEYQKKERFNEISKKIHTGTISNIKQPLSDIAENKDGYSLDEYIQNQYPALAQLQEQEYQSKKQFIKYMIRVQALVDYHKVGNDKIIIQKLAEYQQSLKPQNLQLIQSFGLKDYNIAQYGWQHFQKRFQTMKLYNAVLKDQRLDWKQYQKYLQTNKNFNKKSVIQEMMLKSSQEFRQAQYLVKLPSQSIVQKLLHWGVYTNEPMAVYLGQKLAIQTGQKISHQLALKVSKMLSYKRILPQQFIEKCKKCLKIVGKIDRQLIYSFDKQYQHILKRQNFINYVENYFKQRKDNNQLDDLLSYSPRMQLNQKSYKFYQESIKIRTSNLV